MTGLGISKSCFPGEQRVKGGTIRAGIGTETKCGRLQSICHGWWRGNE